MSEFVFDPEMLRQQGVNVLLLLLSICTVGVLFFPKITDLIESLAAHLALERPSRYKSGRGGLFALAPWLLPPALGIVILFLATDFVTLRIGNPVVLEHCWPMPDTELDPNQLAFIGVFRTDEETDEGRRTSWRMELGMKDHGSYRSVPTSEGDVVIQAAERLSLFTGVQVTSGDGDGRD